MSERDDCAQALDAYRERFGRLLEIQRRVSQEHNLARLPGLVMREVTELLAADRSTLFLFDRQTMALRACFAEGMSGKAIVVPLRMGVIGTAILQRQTINLIDACQHPYFNDEIDAQSGYHTESLLVVPIAGADGQVLGGIELLNTPRGRFSLADEQVVKASAQRLAALDDIDAAAAEREIARLRAQLEFDRGTIFKVDAAAGQLFAVHAEGADSARMSLNMKLGIAGLVALTGEPLLIQDTQGDSRFDASFDRRTGYHTRNILCVPLRDGSDEALGVIQVINCVNGGFTAEDLALLTSVAGVVAIAIDNAHLFHDSDRQFHSLLETLAASIDARDTLTAGHSKRVAQIALGIARELGFAESELDVLEVSALLHDYGKIGIDDAVLKKVGKLDADEFAHMKQHAALTYDILEKIKFSRKYRNVPLIASSHHESLDGKGYPHGYATQEIPFMAKLLTVADVFEALTADRHYRKGMSLEQAYAILDDGIGQKFDGRVVAALRQHLDKGGLDALGLA
ncbi:MAG: GAF domain-containing protein [Rhodocyclaceae bacterium]|nr:GAF domain-containing protein [Rhodocyclaceae bacterium]